MDVENQRTVKVKTREKDGAERGSEVTLTETDGIVAIELPLSFGPPRVGLDDLTDAVAALNGEGK